MKKEKLTRRKEQGEATKKKIYETAQQLFAEHGIDSVSIHDIVTAVGIARGTFYVHFESKNALISSLISDYTNKVDMDYEAYIKTLPPDAPVAELLVAVVGKICDVIEHAVGYDMIKNLYNMQLTSVPHAQDASGYNRALYHLIEMIIEKGIARGEFRALLPAKALSKHLVLALRGLTYEWCIRYPDFDFKKQTLEHFELLLEGIKAKEQK